MFLQTNNFREKDKQLHRQVTIPLQVATNSTPELIHYALKELDGLYRPGYNYHKVGIVAMDIVPQAEVQNSLFDKLNRPKENALMKSLDALHNFMGKEVVKYAVQGRGKKWHLKMAHLSWRYTTNIREIIIIKA